MKNIESDGERIIRVEGDIASLKSSVSSIQGTLALMNDRLSSIGRPNYVLWLSAMGVALTIFTLATGGLFYFMKSEITNQVTPVSIKAASSEMDRHKLNDQVGEIGSRQAKNEKDVSNIQSSLKDQLVEVESQFRAVGQMQNMRHANNQQLFGLLWKKVYGEELPMSSFYPDMSRNKSIEH